MTLKQFRSMKLQKRSRRCSKRTGFPKTEPRTSVEACGQNYLAKNFLWHVYYLASMKGLLEKLTLEFPEKSNLREILAKLTKFNTGRQQYSANILYIYWNSARENWNRQSPSTQEFFSRKKHILQQQSVVKSRKLYE